MKKSLLLLAFALCPLISCNNGGSSDPVKPTTEEVTLTLSNYGTYIATNTVLHPITNPSGAPSASYNTYYVGSSWCRFENCKLVGHYVTGTDITVNLNLSGDGETGTYSSTLFSLKFTVTAASGTVTVYK